MYNLPQMAARVFGTPLMIARAKLEHSRTAPRRRLSGPDRCRSRFGATHFDRGESIAVVSVIGTLVSRSGYLDAASGLQAYGDIADEIAAWIEDDERAGRHRRNGR
jgi:hypothetical protein